VRINESHVNEFHRLTRLYSVSSPEVRGSKDVVEGMNERMLASPCKKKTV